MPRPIPRERYKQAILSWFDQMTAEQAMCRDLLARILDELREMRIGENIGGDSSQYSQTELPNLYPERRKQND